MPQRLKKTRSHRNLKSKKLGASGKHARENHGTTPSIPLDSKTPIQTTIRGRIVKADAVKVIVKPAAKKPAKTKGL